MAGIGSQEYPELTLSDAIAITERVGRENVKTKTGLIAVMGLKEASGYFYHRVSALTKYYGLVDRSLSNITLTPLGERIAHPLSEADKRVAIAEAAGRVPLLRSLYEALGRSFHDADFRTKLRDVTQASLPDIEKTAPFIEKVYRDATQYLSMEMPATSEGNRPGEGPGKDLGMNRSTTDERKGTDDRLPALRHEMGFRTFEGDGVYLKVKKDPEALNEAFVTIQGWLTLHGPSAKQERPAKTKEGE